MNKLTIGKGKNKYDILVDNYKIIIGSNYNLMFDIIRSLLRFYKNDKPSDYANENDNIAKLYIDNRELKNKDILLFYVHKNYSIVEDSKLTSQSLLQKYFEILLNETLLTDTINTINILFESLSQEISEISSISGEFISMTSKYLIKLITPQYYHQENIKDEYDLTLEEIILFQLVIIDYISRNNTTTKKIVVCIEIPELTTDIYNKILNINGCIILVFTTKYIDITDINKVFICENKQIDCADEDSLYRIICDNNMRYLNLQEGKVMIKEYINKKGQHIDFIERLLK